METTKRGRPGDTVFTINFKHINGVFRADMMRTVRHHRMAEPQKDVRSMTCRVPRIAVRLRVLVAGLLAVCAVAPSVPAAAQGRLEARYEASLAGIPVGKGTWTIDIADDQYSAAAQGGSTGLLKTFSGGSGSGAATGRVIAGQLSPMSYTATTSSSKKSESIRMVLSNGAIKDTTIEPVPEVDPDRIPVTDAHRRNVMDPMTGALLRVAGTGDPVSAEACRTSAPIFDGRMRYDLTLDYSRMDTVKSEKGYRGPAVVCSIYFTPVSGYIADRAAIKYLAEQRKMEVWFAPIAGTRVLAPYRVTVPTPLGIAMLEATEFVTSVVPPRSASRTQ
jgi:hypothetical protein